MKKEIRRMISQSDSETIRRMQIAAARKAFHAYERALEAAQKALAHDPARGLGTTVMVKHYCPYSRYPAQEEFECSECGFVARGDLSEWKFCARCAAEIMRFERKPEYEPKEIKLVDVAQEPRPTAIQTEETQTPPKARK
jgi:hypothetical protein